MPKDHLIFRAPNEEIGMSIIPTKESFSNQVYCAKYFEQVRSFQGKGYPF